MLLGLNTRSSLVCGVRKSSTSATMRQVTVDGVVRKPKRLWGCAEGSWMRDEEKTKGETSVKHLQDIFGAVM
jgi:hypothetical protein